MWPKSLTFHAYLPAEPTTPHPINPPIFKGQMGPCHPSTLFFEPLRPNSTPPLHSKSEMHDCLREPPVSLSSETWFSYHLASSLPCRKYRLSTGGSPFEICPGSGWEECGNNMRLKRQRSPTSVCTVQAFNCMAGTAPNTEAVPVGSEQELARVLGGGGG